MNFSPLGEILKQGESWILERLLRYARKTESSQHASATFEPWRCSLNELTKQISRQTTEYKNIPELSPLDDYAQDGLASFGIAEAQKHQAHGVTLTMFFAGLKDYRQSYRDYLEETISASETRDAYVLFVDRCLDQMEFGIITEWAGQKDDTMIEELSPENLTRVADKITCQIICENFPHPVFLINEEGDILHVNLAAKECFSELHVCDTQDCMPAVAHPVFAWMRALNLREMKDKDTYVSEKTLLTRQGYRCFNIFMKKSLDSRGNSFSTIITLSDITERKNTEEQFSRLARVHAVLNHTNQAIVRQKTVDSLFKAICQIAITNGQLKIAAINQVHPQTKTPTTVAYCGETPTAHSSQSLGSVKPNITDIVIKTERSYICNHIQKDQKLQSRADDAKKKGIQAMGCFPIFCKDRLYGTLNLYAYEQGFFHSDIVMVFEEMATDISFALDNFEREKQRQRSEEELWETNNKLQALYKATPLPVVAHTLGGKVLMWNPEAEKVLGWTENETLHRLVPTLPEETIPEFLEKNSRVFAGETISRLEVQRDTKDGQRRDFLLFNTPLYDSQQEIYAIMAVLMDVTDQKKDQERIAYLAHHDHLTGLPNRFFLKEHFARQVSYAQRSKTTLALCVLDLDGFKFINDLLGHPLGDALLCLIGEKLQECIRSTDIVCRMGGDEFVLLFGDLEKSSDLAPMIEKICKIFSTPFDLDGHQTHITMSVGVTLYGTDGSDFDTLFKRADAAMYAAKKTGGNKVEFYQQEIGDRIEKRFLLEKELRKAISSNALCMHYQPICTVGENKIVGAEALIRWKHALWGFVPPDQFIPNAEETNLIIPLGEWILEEVCRTIQDWDKQGVPPITVAVNISARQIFDETFPAFLSKTLQKYGLQPQRLEMEVTEGLFLENTSSVEIIMHQLKALGVNLVLDDFGMGYSSLNYLKRFRIDKLKIDRSFIRDICHDEQDATLTKTIIEMGQNLGLDSVAEGVETQEQLALLQRDQCQYYQGFLFSKPMNANGFASLLKNGYLPDLEPDNQNGCVPYRELESPGEA